VTRVGFFVSATTNKHSCLTGRYQRNDLVATVVDRPNDGY
jgi:hypothetical protein